MVINTDSMNQTYSNSNTQFGLIDVISSGASMSARQGFAAHIQLCQNPELREVQNLIIQMGDLPDNWDGLGGTSPTRKTIDAAIQWLRDMWIDAKNSSRTAHGSPVWLKPHVSIDEEGAIVFEWSAGDKGLFIYISEHEVQFIRDPGTLVLSEMEDGYISSDKERQHLCLWLTK